MNQPHTEPSSSTGPWALQMLHLLVVPALLALTLLSASALYVNWGPALPTAPGASSTAAASAATANAQPQQPAPTEALERLDATLAHLQAP